MQVRLLDLGRQYEEIAEEIQTALGEVLASQRFILGDRGKELEERIAAYCGVRRAVGVASGSDAILVTLMALGVGQGDEVVTTPFTFFSTVSSITRLGARPVFADIDPVTFNIDPARVRGALTERTRAVVVVHLYGQMCEMDPILEAAGERDIPVIEDACQAIGSEYRGRKAGSTGRAGCFSFYPTKNLGGCGDGGMIVTDDPDLAARAEMLRAHGSSGEYIHAEVGINSRLDEIQAAVLLVKLRHVDRWNERRRAHAAFYDGELADLDDVVCPSAAPDRVHTYHQYVIRADRRDALRAFLRDGDVGSGLYYPVPLHLQQCFARLGGARGDFPEAERAASETLALPVYPELNERERGYVAGLIAEFYRGGGKAGSRR